MSLYYATVYNCNYVQVCNYVQACNYVQVCNYVQMRETLCNCVILFATVCTIECNCVD